MREEGELRFTGIVCDVTERKRAEEERSRIAAIVEYSDDAIVDMALDGTVTSWNPAAESLYGYTAEEILGESLAILVPEDRAEEAQRLLDFVRRGERVEHSETVRVAKDGRRPILAGIRQPSCAPVQLVGSGSLGGCRGRRRERETAKGTRC